MVEGNEAERPAEAKSSLNVPYFDVKKLHSLQSEQQELYLLNYVTNLVKLISDGEPNDIDTDQQFLKNNLLQIINLSSPAPSRVIRASVGRSFAGIYEKGNRKTLYETINDLCSIALKNKTGKDLGARHTSISCLGAIFESSGGSAIGISGFATSSILRCLKVSQEHVGYRGTCYRSLAKIVKGTGHSIDESVARDIFKHARKAIANDKAYIVQSHACSCVEELVRQTTYFDNLGDFERIQACIWKALDSPSLRVRNAGARAFASVLVKSFVENPLKNDAPKTKKSKKANRKQGKSEVEDDEYEHSDTTLPEKTTALLQFGVKDLLKQLSLHYQHNTTTNRARVGMISCFAIVLNQLGPDLVESHYGEIASHLLVELLPQVAVKSSRHRQLMTRKCVALLLEDIIGRQLLSEDGQLAAMRYLINDIVKDYPQTLNERTEPSKETLISTLSAITSLLQLVGCAAYPLGELCRDGLLAVLQHPSYTVQIYASFCLKSLVQACPHLLVPLVTICLNNIKREVGQLGATRHSNERCIGFANGLSAVMSVANYHPIYGSLEIYSRVFNFATALLKSSSSSDLRTSSTQIQVAWVLLGGLMSLGPQFVKIQLPQLLLLWKNALPKPINRSAMQQDALEISFLAHLRNCALGCIYAFLEYNSKILTVDIVKRLGQMFQNTMEFLHNSPEGKPPGDHGQNLFPNIQFADLILMVRRRVMQCCCRLISSSSAGSNEMKLQSSLLPFAISMFADPDNFVPSTLSTAIAGSTGSFETIWELSDNSAYGLTSLLKGSSVQFIRDDDKEQEQELATKLHESEAINDLVR